MAGCAIERVHSFKLLGVVINDGLTWNDHVDHITRKAAKRLYYLVLLRHSGVPLQDLVTIFTSTIRFILEYACEVWGPNLPAYLSDCIEHIQFRALKILLPWLSYNQALLMSGLERLSVRRERLCQSFFLELCESNHMLNYLLPINSNPRTLRKKFKYSLPKVRTNRLKNSPVYYGLFRFQ